MRLRTGREPDPLPSGLSRLDADTGRGYSMIELVVVVGLIVIMAAIAIPNIAGYTRNYRVRGATQQLAGEMQTARNKAIVRNTNAGVAFAVLDANSYRFTILDDDETPAPPVPGRGLQPIRDLPAGVVFVPAAAGPLFGVGFDRLGRVCQFNSTGCAGTQTAASMCLPADPRCTDRPAGSFLARDPTGTVTVRVRDEQTAIERWVSIAAGGRVMSQK
jgi:prepilin-type N-terminal cleavage/methylation domain-containing protein